MGDCFVLERGGGDGQSVGMKPEYDLEKFISGCIGLGYPEVVLKAQEEERRMEARTAGGRRRAPKAREDGASKFAAELRSLLFFLYHFAKPMTGSFALYQPLVEWLVQRGDFKPEDPDKYRDLLSS